MQRSTDIAALSVQRYQEVIDAVVGRVRGEFNQEGIDESVLDEVRALWEAKLVATGVIGEPSNEGQQVIQQQLRVGMPPGVGALPYAAMQQQHLLALRQQQLAAAAAAAAGGVPGALPVGMPPHMLVAGAGGQQVNMAALHQMMQAQAAQAQVAQAQAQAQAAALTAEQKRKLEAGLAEAREAKLQRVIPQQDGPADDAGEDGGAEGDAAGDGGGSAAAAEEEDDDPLTEDEEGSGDEVDEAAVANTVLGQFEKVQRSKSKWKIVLKDCILTLDNRDYLCRKVTGEMDFS